MGGQAIINGVTKELGDSVCFVDGVQHPLTVGYTWENGVQKEIFSNKSWKWKKYSFTDVITTSTGSSSTSYSEGDYEQYAYIYQGTAYTIDPDTGEYILCGEVSWGLPEEGNYFIAGTPNSGPMFDGEAVNSGIMRGYSVYHITYVSEREYDGYEYMYDYTEYASIRDYTLVDEVKGVQGDYPINGIHTDGYHYCLCDVECTATVIYPLSTGSVTVDRDTRGFTALRNFFVTTYNNEEYLIGLGSYGDVVTNIKKNDMLIGTMGNYSNGSVEVESTSNINVITSVSGRKLNFKIFKYAQRQTLTGKMDFSPYDKGFSTPATLCTNNNMGRNYYYKYVAGYYYDPVNDFICMKNFVNIPGKYLKYPVSNGSAINISNREDSASYPTAKYVEVVDNKFRHVPTSVGEYYYSVYNQRKWSEWDLIDYEHRGTWSNHLTGYQDIDSMSVGVIYRTDATKIKSTGRYEDNTDIYPVTISNLTSGTPTEVEECLGTKDTVAILKGGYYYVPNY